MTLIHRLILAAALAAACVVPTASSAATGDLGTSCGTTTTAFARFGDPASYFLAPGGNFETQGGWTLSSGASIGTGNEPFYLHAAGDRSSLLLGNGATATSPRLCLGLLTPGLRFVAVGRTSGASVRVKFVVDGLLGPLAVLDGGVVAAGGTWAPSPKLSTTASQLLAFTGAQSVQVQFISSGSVSIDDVYVDPFLTH